MSEDFLDIYNKNLLEYEVKLGTAGIRLTDIETLKKVAVKICIYCLKYSNCSGLMITASHNPAEFNGLKLVIGEGDLMNVDEEEELNTFINGQWREFENQRCKIYIGRDTRESGVEIVNYLMETFSNSGVSITDLGIVHTPYLYWFVEKNNRAEYLNYYEDIKENFSRLPWNDGFKYPFIVDCANGSISQVRNILKNIFDEKGLNYMFINTGDGKINDDCGSDVCWNKRQIKIWNREGNNLTGNVKGFTFDGDGDRILFFEGLIIGSVVMINRIYSGDHFICFYSKLLSKFEGSGLVFTPYSNFGMIDYIIKRDIPYSICAPGVKNLIKTSYNYKISCIFEYNGHGNIEWNKNIEYDVDIEPYLRLLYSKAGDVIGHCLIVLNEFLSNYDFDFFEILPQYHGCIKVKNMKLFKSIKTNELETDIIYPVGLANDLENICKGKDNRVVVRPSGTEPIFRVMIEGENGEELFKKIERKIEF